MALSFTNIDKRWNFRKAISKIEIKISPNKLGSNTNLCMRENNFTLKSENRNLQPTKVTHLLPYMNENYFLSFGTHHRKSYQASAR